MIDAAAFLVPARRLGFDFFTGVPCSFLTPLINRAIGEPGLAYVTAASEGEAVAIAAGAWLAGRKTVVMCQNSGLGNAVNPLTSLNFPFRVPTLLIVTWRGGPGLSDEPQHQLMGKITPALLDVLGISHAPFPKSEKDVAATLAWADAGMEHSGLPYALIMEKGDVRDEGVEPPPSAARPPGTKRDFRANGALPSRFAALERLLALIPDEAAVIATTGKCGRELFTIADRSQHLYQVGSMGCAAAMGLGVALNTGHPVVILDGDGAALMKMGTLATIGACAPGNFVHVVLDNASYDSTGGQPTVSPSVDFAAAALACGYGEGVNCDSLAGLERALATAFDRPGPRLVHLRIAPGSRPGLGRPRLGPVEVAARFKAFLGG